MNSLTRTATVMPRMATQMTGRRFASATPAPAPTLNNKSTFKKDWLSDPSTYPIIGVLSFATVMAASYIGYKVSCCNDVRITSKAKGHVVRTWA